MRTCEAINHPDSPVDGKPATYHHAYVPLCAGHAVEFRGHNLVVSPLAAPSDLDKALAHAALNANENASYIAADTLAAVEVAIAVARAEGRAERDGEVARLTARAAKNWESFCDQSVAKNEAITRLAASEQLCARMAEALREVPELDECAFLCGRAEGDFIEGAKAARERCTDILARCVAALSAPPAPAQTGGEAGEPSEWTNAEIAAVLLSQLWRWLDAGGLSGGRGYEGRIVEAVRDLLDIPLPRGGDVDNRPSDEALLWEARKRYLTAASKRLGGPWTPPAPTAEGSEHGVVAVEGFPPGWLSVCSAHQVPTRECPRCCAGFVGPRVQLPETFAAIKEHAPASPNATRTPVDPAQGWECQRCGVQAPVRKQFPHAPGCAVIVEGIQATDFNRVALPVEAPDPDPCSLSGMVSRLIDRALPEAVADWVRTHIAECSDCAATLHDYMQIQLHCAAEMKRIDAEAREETAVDGAVIDKLTEIAVKAWSEE